MGTVDSVVFATLSEHDIHYIRYEKLLDQQDKHKKKEDKTCRSEHACMSSENTARVAMARLFKVALYMYLTSPLPPQTDACRSANTMK